MSLLCNVHCVTCIYSLPYVEATLLELVRYKTLAPFALPHSTKRDAEVGGYFVPKGTMVHRHFNSVLLRYEKKLENDFFGFPKAKWLHLTGEVDKSVRLACQIFSGFNVPKITKIG